MKIILREQPSVESQTLKCDTTGLSFNGKMVVFPSTVGFFYVIGFNKAYGPRLSVNPPPVVVSTDVFYGSKDAKASLRADGFTDILAVFGRNESNEEILLVNGNVNILNDVEVEIVPKDLAKQSNYGILSAYIDWTPNPENLKLKKELLREINNQDSISALEKQVDLLTSLVLETLPTKKSEQWVKDLKEVFPTIDSTSSIGKSKALESIVAYKQKLRRLISDYVSKKK